MRYACFTKALGGILLASALTTASPALSQTLPFDPEGHVVYAEPQFTDNLDPAFALVGEAIWPMYAIMDRLVHIDDKANLVPGLALEWNFTDDKTVEMKLRQGVTFQDGAAFDAAAVKANFDRYLSLPNANSNITAATKSLASVDVVDDLTVRFNLSRVNYGFIDTLALTAGMMISPAALNNADIDRFPVGAGMYKVAEVSPGQRILVERWDGYWDPEAVKAKSMEFRAMSQAETRLNGVRSGQIHAAPIDGTQVQTARSAPNLEVDVGQTLNVYTMYTNLTAPIFQSLEARRAVQHAIDRRGLVDQLQLGFGEPTLQMSAPGYVAYNEAFGPDYYAYDVEKAKALLEQSGLAPEDRKFRLQLSNRSFDIRLGETIQSMLSEVGIDVTLQIVDPVRFNDFTQKMAADAAIGRKAGRTDYHLTMVEIFAAPEDGGWVNPGGVTSEPQMKAMREAATLPTNDPRRAELLKEAAGHGVEAALKYPLYAVVQPYARNKCLQGFKTPMSGGMTLRGVGLAAGCQ